MKVSVEFTTRFHNMDTKVGFYSNILSRNILTFILKQPDPFTLFKVQLDTGTIKGFTDNGITKFLGVPYASIPSQESKYSLNSLHRRFIINFYSSKDHKMSSKRSVNFIIDMFQWDSSIFGHSNFSHGIHFTFLF